MSTPELVLTATIAVWVVGPAAAAVVWGLAVRRHRRALGRRFAADVEQYVRGRR